MSIRERHPLVHAQPVPPDTDETPGAIDASRETGDAFLRAADAALARALSGTPEAFLSQNRQMGGQ